MCLAVLDERGHRVRQKHINTKYLTFELSLNNTSEIQMIIQRVSDKQKGATSGKTFGLFLIKLTILSIQISKFASLLQVLSLSYRMCRL